MSGLCYHLKELKGGVEEGLQNTQGSRWLFGAYSHRTETGKKNPNKPNPKQQKTKKEKTQPKQKTRTQTNYKTPAILKRTICLFQTGKLNNSSYYFNKTKTDI